MIASKRKSDSAISLLKFFKDIPLFPENQVHMPRPYSGSLHLPRSISLNSFCCHKPLHLLFPLPKMLFLSSQFLSLILGIGLQRFLCVALIWQLWYLHYEPCTMILALWASLESRLWFNLYCDCMYFCGYNWKSEVVPILLTLGSQHPVYGLAHSMITSCVFITFMKN